jgi:malate dehydrogenase (oxaloacetate-decarboxylating)
VKYDIRREPDGTWSIATSKRGSAVLTDPLLNKGTAFSAQERHVFDLDGLLPFGVTDRALQVDRAFEHITAKGDEPLEKYVAMAALQDRNETLFFQVLSAHVEELLPIVYTPTVGTAALRFSHLFRRGRGLWITPDHRGRIDEVLDHARSDDIRLIVVTDNERILGLGDQGAGGMVIPVGKLALYTLAAGIHPAFTLPVSLDVGTDNRALLDDPLYAGWPHPRLRGPEYEPLVDEFVDAVRRRWPRVLLQWEDFKKDNAFRLLDRHHGRIASFNDDIQGTGAVTAAGILAAGRLTGTKLADQRVLLVGAGAAGIGIARHIRHAMVAAGDSWVEATTRLALTDTAGLLIADRPGLSDSKAEFAWPPELAAVLGLDASSSLAEIVEDFHPTVIVGTTGEPGVFDRSVIEAMCRHAERPLVMALSNPTSKTEAVPADVVAWSGGRALVATGSPFDPVTFEGRMIPVPQCNNVYVFPGVGLGAIVSGATQVTDHMFAAAAASLADQVTDADLDRGCLYPPLAELRAVSRRIAVAVARAARDDGVGADLTDDEFEAAVDHETWDLEYPRLIPVGGGRRRPAGGNGHHRKGHGT